MTYPLKFRQHVLAVREKEQLTFAQTAERFVVGIASVMRWAKNPCPKNTREREPSRIHNDALLQDVAAYPDAFQHERAERMGCSARGISDALRRPGITRKKKFRPSPGRR